MTTVASPCTGICKLDTVTSWCLGCGRDGQEIADWRHQSEAWRGAVWEAIPTRLAQMGVACRRLPWTTDDIRDFVTRTLADGRGTWVMGVVGAVAEFTAAPGQRVSVARDGDDLIAHTKGGAAKLRINDDVRALTFDLPDALSEPRIVLAVKRERGHLGVSETIADLGEDRDALISGDGTRLFELGLGRQEARFCVRVGQGPARDALEQAVGVPFSTALPALGGPLLTESPIRVVQTALGRSEVEGKIPPPNAQSPAGPHTHLLPDHLATGRALPVGMDLPRAYIPGAVFYPPKVV